jgi:adenosylcobinamide-phosphate synthase
MIAAAREKLSFVVSRDVDRYQPPDIARATVETVAENFVDGVLSPLMFVAIGGASLGMAFKMISTLDSMVGYKNNRYLRFGRVAARIDDAANYIPARLSVFVIAAAAGLFSADAGRRAFRTAVHEGRRHSSPNAGRPEAGFAGALGVWLNGPNYYHGRRVDKPYIGARFGPAATRHIVAACRLMIVSALLSAAAAWGLSVIVNH